MNTFGKMPFPAAVFLNVPGSKEYINYCFRSSDSLLAGLKQNTMEIKKHGGRKSTRVAEGCTDQTLIHKKAIAERTIPMVSSSVIVALSTSFQELTANAS